ncbi:MAG: hypothetical protein JNM84_02840 [Planctomycetes bacterium]|nr:hypothetical protein [Planctomycetota bacterium]
MLLLLAPTRFELEALLGPVPGLGPACVPAPGQRALRVGLVGFGLAAAGITTARHLERERPTQVLLVGIAGSFDLARAPLASVHRIEAVSCHGIGVGEGREHIPAARVGFAQIPREICGEELGERLRLAAPPPPLDRLPAAELLSATSAAANAGEAATRRAQHPRALLEDMEGYAVALAAILAGAPLSIVRAVSNAIGERDKTRWEVHAALSALRLALAPLLASERSSEDRPR